MPRVLCRLAGFFCSLVVVVTVVGQASLHSKVLLYPVGGLEIRVAFGELNR